MEPVGPGRGQAVGGAVDAEGGGAFVALGVEWAYAVGCDVCVPGVEGVAGGFEHGVEGSLRVGRE